LLTLVPLTCGQKIGPTQSAADTARRSGSLRIELRRSDSIETV
jgi:hypothetical protein